MAVRSYHVIEHLITNFSLMQFSICFRLLSYLLELFIYFLMEICWKILGKDSNTKVSWSFVWIIILGLAAAGVGGYAVYKYRIRVCLRLHKILVTLLSSYE